MVCNQRFHMFTKNQLVICGNNLLLFANVICVSRLQINNLCECYKHFFLSVILWLCSYALKKMWNNAAYLGTERILFFFHNNPHFFMIYLMSSVCINGVKSCQDWNVFYCRLEVKENFFPRALLLTHFYLKKNVQLEYFYYLLIFSLKEGHWNCKKLRPCLFFCVLYFSQV